MEEVAVLDIGSRKISVLIATRGINNTISILGQGECEYDGFLSGAWLSPSQLSSAFDVAINIAQSSFKRRISSLTIGVPGEFCDTVCHTIEHSFLRRKRITESDIADLENIGKQQVANDLSSIINIQPIQYTLDDGQRVFSPVGLLSSKLGAVLSFTRLSLGTMSMLESIVQALGIQEYDFCSSVLAQSLFLFEEAKRDRGIVLVDCGYLTTTVAIIKGDGLLAHYSFSSGGAHIMNDLMTHLDMDMSVAQHVLKNIKLPLIFSEEDNYELTLDQNIFSYNATVVNEIVKGRIRSIGRSISDSLTLSELSNNYEVFLTGGGISYLRGAKEILSKKIARNVEIVAPPLPQYSRPHLTSRLGLVYMALRAGLQPEESTTKKKIWNWLRRGRAV